MKRHVTHIIPRMRGSTQSQKKGHVVRTAIASRALHRRIKRRLFIIPRTVIAHFEELFHNARLVARRRDIEERIVFKRKRVLQCRRKLVWVANYLANRLKIIKDQRMP